MSFGTRVTLHRCWWRWTGHDPLAHPPDLPAPYPQTTGKVHNMTIPEPPWRTRGRVRRLEQRVDALEAQMAEITPIIAALSCNPGAMLAVVQTLENEDARN